MWETGSKPPVWLEKVLTDSATEEWLKAAREKYEQEAHNWYVYGLAKLVGENFPENLTVGDALEQIEADPAKSELLPRLRSLSQKTALEMVQQEFMEGLRKNIMSRLPRPCPLTSDDFWDAFTRGISETRANPDDIDWALEHIGESLAEDLDDGEFSERFVVATVTDSFAIPPDGVLYKNGPTEVRVLGVETREVTWRGSGIPATKESHLSCEITGCFSRSALEPAVTELKDLLRTTLVGVSDIIRPKQAGKHRDVPALEGDDLCVQKDFLSQLLTAYYTTADAKKDTLSRRVRNAVILMVEAQRQTNIAIALSLNCAAMEAVLGRKGTDITNTLADNVAALLEPEPEQRAAAVDFVKKLYETRSRVLHGERIEADEDALRHARCLVCALLRAVLGRREFMARAGYDPESPDAFLNELRQTRFVRGQPMGCEPLQITALWRNPGFGPASQP